MFLALFRHSLAHRIAQVKFVWFDEAELVVPGFGPVATLVTGKPEAVTGDDDVIAKGFMHAGMITKPRPVVAGAARRLEKWPRIFVRGAQSATNGRGFVKDTVRER